MNALNFSEVKQKLAEAEIFADANLISLCREIKNFKDTGEPLPREGYFITLSNMLKFSGADHYRLQLAENLVSYAAMRRLIDISEQHNSKDPK